VVSVRSFRWPRTVALAVAWIVTAVGCGNEGGDGLSPTQEAFLRARGTPPIFLIAFADQQQVELEIVATSGIRRIESWLYRLPENDDVVSEIFDGGHYVDSRLVDRLAVSLPPPPFTPADIGPNLTVAQIQTLAGGGAEIETATVGTLRMEVLRYRPTAIRPPMAFTFLDDRLTAVVVGMEIDPATMGGF